MKRRLFLGGALVATPAFASAQSDRELIGQLDREVIALKQRIRALEGQLETCGAGEGDPGKIYPELVQVFSGGPVKVDRQGAVALVTLPGDTLFSQGGLTLREEADFALDLLATALKLHTATRALVVGHTEADPPPLALRRSYPTNWELSVARGAAVARALVERFAVPAGRVTAAGRAGSQPVADDDTPEGRALNRRVVVHVLPTGAS
ncbi:MAG: OmpA/MotB family protein [Myxococcota bacterium]